LRDSDTPLNIPHQTDIEENETLRKWNRYNLEKRKGVWTFLWEKTCPVWISDVLDSESRKNLRHLVNEVPDAPNLPSEHFEFFEATRAIIAIPFEHKVEHSGETWGFLDL
jgi:hypothetical protein